MIDRRWSSHVFVSWILAVLLLTSAIAKLVSGWSPNIFLSKELFYGLALVEVIAAYALYGRAARVSASFGLCLAVGGLAIAMALPEARCG